MNEPALAQFQGNAQARMSRIGSTLVFFTLEINRIADDRLSAMLDENSALAAYRPWIDDLRVYRPYQLSDELEQMLVQRGLVHLRHIGKRGKRHDPPDQILKRLIARDRFSKPCGIELCHLRAIQIGECLRLRLRRVEIGGEFGIIDAAIKRAQIPFRQISHFGRRVVPCLRHNLSFRALQFLLIRLAHLLIIGRGGGLGPAAADQNIPVIEDFRRLILRDRH